MKKLLFLLFLIASFNLVAQDASRLLSIDDRSVNHPPSFYNTEMKFEFKNKSTVGLTGVNYVGLLTLSPVNGGTSSNDYQLGLSSNGMYFRDASSSDSTWGAWQKILTEDDSFNTLSLLDSRYVDSDATEYASEVRFETKTNSALGLSGGNYSALMTIAPLSGSAAEDFQLDFNKDGLFYRTGGAESNAWDPWTKVLTDTDPLYSLNLLDNRNENGGPDQYSHEIRFERKNNSILGLGGGAYSGLMTVAPYSALTSDFDYQLNFNRDGLYYRVGNTEDSTWDDWIEVNTGGNVWQKDASDNISFETGSVAIGTNAAPTGYSLAVGGKIIAEEIKVALSGTWPDYVFDSDYELRTLNETKEFIAEHQHLPEIPSAEEIEEEGVSLGEMNMKLLKKIEELTLYQIELLERLESVEASNKEIEKKLQKLTD